ncbi:MAG: hypothetical protein IIW20_03745 [Clostridia bacterium]|jgi:hypothetical protein|nr:hypothetical protein [Clostridia bacterium]MBQ5800979.1 hypothetical protein [Clostridia bacterium]
MIKTDMPIALLGELVKDKEAMRAYAALSEKERQRILIRARKAQTKEEMSVIVMSLSDRISAVEYQ